MKPEISVIIPSYNHADYLPTCLNSILEQSIGNIEIIVVDDGSTDNTEEVIKYFPFVKYIQQTNSGPSVARNKGLEIATGKFVAFLDADDFWLDGFAHTMLPSLENRDENTALIACGWHFLNIHGEKIGKGIFPRKEYFNWKDMILGNPLTMSSALCRLKHVISVGGFDPEIKGVEDWYLWLKLLNAGYDFSTLDSVLVGYRIVNAGISHNVQGMFENSMRLLAKVYTELVPPQEVFDLRPQTTAYRYLDASAGFYYIRDDLKAESYYRHGVDIWPELLTDPHAIYTLVCARQPQGFKMTADYFDLEEAYQRVKSILLTYLHDHPKFVKNGMGNLYMVVARMARAQNKYSMARKYALLGLRFDPKNQGINFLKTLARTIWAK